jgi:PAS domain S-box-containing protein
MRDCLNDLASIMALPALWVDSEPHHIVSTLADALLGTLRLAFVVVRLHDPHGGPSIEVTRVADSWQGAMGASMAPARLGLRGEIGIVVTGSHQLDFPAETDRLVLDVAANQATVALQRAHLVAERKRAQEAVRDSGRESLLIVDSIPGLVALLSANGALEVANRQILEYTGRTLEELQQWGTSDVVHPEELPQVIDVFGRSIVSGSPYDIVMRIRRSDGVYRWFQNSGFPLRDTNGQIVRWCVLLTDVDDAKRAGDAIRESERQFRRLVETIPALVWRGTPEGELDYLNQRAVEYLGHTAESLSGGKWLELVHPDHRDATVRRWMQSATTGLPYDDVYQLRRADGQFRWIQSVGEPFHDTNGLILHWYGLVIDIEDRKRVEDELRRSEAFLAQAQRLTQTGSLWWEVSTGKVTWSNETFRLLDLPTTITPTVEMALNRVHPEDLSLVRAILDRSTREGANVDTEHRLLMPDGSVKHVHVVLQNIGQHLGHPEFVGAVTDITERKRAEAELRQAYDRLQRAGAELSHVSRVTTVSALTASIAHEVNQPLAGIITNAGTCLRMLDAVPPNIEGARETARRTIRDGNRASDVITRLRALFSKREFTLEPLDLNEAAREVMALSLNDLQRNRIILQAELADDLPIVTGDRIQLQQVILNLLRNAADAMVDVHDRPRQLRIETEREDGDRVRLTVRDTGSGLPAQSRDSLFDAFYSTKSGGMGIGLFVSRSIVERHHGRLWAEPNDGPGATFSFSIPRGPGVDAPGRLRTAS